jgi:hypothetical protein
LVVQDNDAVLQAMLQPQMLPLMDAKVRFSETLESNGNHVCMRTLHYRCILDALPQRYGRVVVT